MVKGTFRCPLFKGGIGGVINLLFKGLLKGSVQKFYKKSINSPLNQLASPENGFDITRKFGGKFR